MTADHESQTASIKFYRSIELSTRWGRVVRRLISVVLIIGFAMCLAEAIAPAAMARSVKSANQENKSVCNENALTGTLSVDDLWRLYYAMKDAPKKKEEFETTKAFRARQNAWLAQFEKSYLIEKFGTPYLVVDAGKLETAYDADKGVLKVGSRLSSALPGILSVDEEYFSRELGSLNYRRLDFRIANSERYVASTAFGVKAEVTKESVTILGISLGVADGTHLWPPPPGKYPFNKPGVLKVRLSPATAREWSKGVYLLVVGRLAPPFALITFHAHTPTLSEPLDQTGDINVIVVHPLCAVVFSKEPRRLLKEVPLH